MSRLYQEGDRPIPGHMLLQFLGEGGFGEVWKAQNPHKIEVALKIVRIQGKQGLREVLAIRQLRNVRHPNLIPIFGFWLKDQEDNILENAAADSMSGFMLDGDYQFFVAMGLADKSLSDRLQECRKENMPGIPIDELMQYMEESARALDFLNTPSHSMGGQEKVSIEHCDIKPQNLLLVGGSVQICDFGLVRVLQHGVKQQHSASFSHHYVAPELLKRDLGPTRGTDQYSLAISYAQLRTGKLPFGDVTFAPAILTAHLEGNLDFSFLPQRERTILAKATSLNPALRYPSVKAFVDALKDALGGTSRASRPAAPGVKGPLRPGAEIVPGYKLEELIGRGSFGEVWRTSAPGRLKKALKIIRNLDLASSRQEMRSLELITEVRHPHLMQIEAYYLLDAEGEVISDEARDDANAPKADTLIIVSELAETHLGARLIQCYKQAGSGIPPQELMPYMQGVAAALDRLNHQHDIIHRDVKPENILLVGGSAKLADFGLAKALEGSSALVHTKSIGMTPAYAAPELCSGRIEESTDQYSLALTYYHLRTGRLATGEASDLSELIQAHLHNRLSFDGVPDIEEKVLRRGSALDSKERYPSCTAFVQALAATFSRAQLPDDWQAQGGGDASAKITHQGRSAHGADTTHIEWERDANLEYQALAVQTDESAQPPGTDTVKRLTDTSRDRIKHQRQKSKTSIEGPRSTRIKPFRRRRRLGPRLAALALLIAFVGGIVSLIFILPKRRSTEIASNSSATETTPGNQGRGTPSVTPTKEDTPRKPTKTDVTPVPPPATPAEILKSATTLLAQDKPLDAALRLIELAPKLNTDSAKELRQQALLLAGECRRKLPAIEDNKQRTLSGAYREWANAYFDELAHGLRQDAADIDWKKSPDVAGLASENHPWVLAFLVEREIHDQQADDKAALAAVVKQLDAAMDTRLGSYGHYLRGIAKARLDDPEQASKSFLKITKDAETNWETRRAAIVATLESAFAVQKKQLLDEKQWQKLAAATAPLQEFDKLLEAIVVTWSTRPAAPEDQALHFLAVIAGSPKPEQIQAALAYVKDKKLGEIETLPPVLDQAFLARWADLMISAKTPPREILPVASRFVQRLQQSATPLTGKELFEQTKPYLAAIASLGAQRDLPPQLRRQTAHLIGFRGKLVLENVGEPWLGEKNPLATARDDLAAAIGLLFDFTGDQASYRVLRAISLLELDSPDWQQGLPVPLQVDTYEKSLRPFALYLKGSQEITKGRKSKTQKDKLDSLKAAQQSLQSAIEGLQQDKRFGQYVLNLARIGKSSAHLEYANFYVNKDEAKLRIERGNHLKDAETAATEALGDVRSTLRPRALLALGNAIEDSGVLLDIKRYGEAETAFDKAADASKDKPEQQAKALASKGRAKFRNSDPDRAVAPLNDALKLVKTGDVAADAYYWLGRVKMQAKQYPEAQIEFTKSEEAAVLPNLRDRASCAAFDALLRTSWDIPYKDKLPIRIRVISDLLPKFARVDEQVQLEADFLRLRGLNELGNLHLNLAQTDPKDPKAHLNSVSEQAAKLAEENDPLKEMYAQCSAARLRTWVKLLSAGSAEEIFSETDANKQLAAYVKRWSSATKTTEPFGEAALLELLNLRFSLLIDRYKTLMSKIPGDIALADTVVKAIDRQSGYYPVMLAHAGLLRRSTLTIIEKDSQLVAPEVIKGFDKRSLRTKALEQIQSAANLLPDHRDNWKWYLSLAGLAESEDERRAFGEKCLQLAKQRGGINLGEVQRLVEENVKGK